MNTTFYAEFDSSGMPIYPPIRLWSIAHHALAGPGGNTTARTPLDHILTEEEERNFTIDKVFLERPRWIDFEYVL